MVVFFFQLQDLVGLVISMLLLGDFSLVLLTLLQMFSFSLADVFLVLFILPLGILLPFPAGINALFSQGPRRSAGLARVYALWNITSLFNVVSNDHINFHFLNSIQTSLVHSQVITSFVVGSSHLIHFFALLSVGIIPLWICSLKIVEFKASELSAMDY